LSGKRVLITGASSGLGFAVARQLAALDAELIMAVRSGIPEKGDEVKKRASSNKVHMLFVDLADFKSIQNLVEKVKSDFGTIDILICNAAVVVKEARKTSYGLDEMFTVNYLAKFFLVNSLLRENCFNTHSKSLPRIIFVSSESHRNPKEFEWGTFGQFTPHNMAKTVDRYGYYKLLLTTFAQELERRINRDLKPAFSIFTLCPGPVNTNIAREAPSFVQPLMKLIFKLFFNSPEKAAEPVVYLSASTDMEGINKDYLFLMSRRAVDDKASDQRNGAQLWQETEQLLRKHKVWQD
jgi:NAD(P)-dependent dehydrogenase (short-subunit alcohol dehydrogenase family)